jgi:type IV secretion system protein VirB1
MQRILQECFVQASRSTAGSPAQLLATLSCYNTGNPRSGLTNGYVGRVLAAAQGARPGLQGAAASQAASSAGQARRERRIHEETSR